MSTETTTLDGENPTPEPAPEPEIALNLEKQEILKQILNSEQNFFITGNAGTGKSVLLQAIRAECKKISRAAVVVAPTGIAAFNVEGRTIHSTFQFPLGILTPKKLKGRSYNRKTIALAREMEVLIVDEISMVRADTLHAMDVFLQKARQEKNFFGGVQVILFGDIAQLPPVLTPKDNEKFLNLYDTRYFFSADCLGEGDFQYINLEENFRQGDDQGFVEILNRVRANATTQADLDILNGQLREDINEDAITLVTRNDRAEAINKYRLNQLLGAEVVYSAKKSASFRERVLAPEKLELKKGARVMLLKNLTEKLVNGAMGEVEELNEHSVLVRFDNKTLQNIEPYTWGQEDETIGDEEDEMSLDFEFKIPEPSENPIDSVKPNISGTYTQIPLTLAWATTIHKSQGKTFDNVNIDLGGQAFEHGHTYVALSRCRSLQGITLLSPIQASDIQVDESVAEFNRKSSGENLGQ